MANTTTFRTKEERERIRKQTALNTSKPFSHSVGVWKDYAGPIGASLMLEVVNDRGGIVRYWTHRFSINRTRRGQERFAVLTEDGQPREGLPALGVKDARAKAILRHGQAAHKVDPRWGVAGNGDKKLFVELLDEAIAKRTPDGKGTYANIENPDERSEWKRVRELTSPFHHHEVSKVRATDVERALEPYWNAHPICGNRIRIRIERVFQKAIRDEIYHRHNPASLKMLSVKNSGELESHFKLMAKIRARTGKSEHQPALPWQRVPAYMVRLRADDSLVARTVEFGILSALRSVEVRRIEWGMIDWEKNILVCAKHIMKMGREHDVVLTADMVALLKALPGYGKSRGLIFPGKHGLMDTKTLLNCMRRHLVDEDRAHLKCASEDITFHGFRASFRSYADAKHLEEFHVLEISFAHVVGDKAQAAYLRRDETNARRRPVHEAWSAYCGSGVSAPQKPAGATNDNVVQIRRAG